MTPEEAVQELNRIKEQNKIRRQRYYENNKEKVKEYAREYQRKRRDIVEQAKKIIEENSNNSK